MIAAFIVQPENKKGGETMSDLYLYNPDICDGDFCPMDCDRCPKADACIEAAEEEDE